MSELDFPDVSGTSLIAEASMEDAVLSVRLRGVADQETHEAMAAVTAATHAEALRLGVATVVVDLRGLEFMSSSCVKSFITWLVALQEEGAAARYVVRFVLDPGFLWQHRTLEALRRLAPDVLSFEG